MFTGIIESLGTVKAIEQKGEDFSLTIDGHELDVSDVNIGDSIAVNGVCLTVVTLENKSFSADVSNETLRYSSLGQMLVGAKVNLEKALTPSSRLGGHLVSGHVDGLATIVDSYADGRAIRYVLEAPKELAKYIASKGSICIDGISLTVNEVDQLRFMLNIVPHTAQQTTAGDWQKGLKVNLEVDVIARYLERLLHGVPSEDDHDISEQFLAEHGFMK